MTATPLAPSVRSFHLLACLLLGAFAAGCAAPPPLAPSPFPVPVFEAPRVIDALRGGFEPAVAIGPDSLVVCSLRGVGRGSDLWRSEDRGRSFEYVGIDPPAGLPAVRSGAGDLGGGDCDVAFDSGGAAYLVDLWGGGASLARSRDGGSSWSGQALTVARTPLDRPWVLGGEPGEVFVAVNQVGADQLGPLAGIWVARSTDHGESFSQQVRVTSNEGRVGLHSNLVMSGGRLFLAYWRAPTEGVLQFFVAVSDDSGLSWSESTGPRQEFEPGPCGGPAVFPILAATDAGRVALVWAIQPRAAERVDLFAAFSQDGGETWSPGEPVVSRPGTRAFPWAAADASGRLGVVWYESEADATLEGSTAGAACVWAGADDATWYLHYAALAMMDGRLRSSEARVDAEPVHVGALDRPYAERIHAAFDPDGAANLVYVADRDGVARAMFAREAAT